MKTFPNDFLWGASTSAYQFEGAIDQGGKVPSIMDNLENSEFYPKDITGFKDASDHYHHWKEDIALMAEMGFKSYRFSISWPRIVKNKEGHINQEGLDFYHKILDELKKYNIEPVVTIWHFDMPQFISDEVKIYSKEFSQYYSYYAKVLFENFGNKVKYWLTINELNMFVLAGEIIGLIPPNSNISKWQVMHNLNIAQAKAIKLCHEMLPNAKIGPAPNISSVYPSSNKPIDYNAKLNMDQLRNWIYLDAACKGSYGSWFINLLKKINQEFEISLEDQKILQEGKPDFIAFNYYSTLTVEHMSLSDSTNKNKSDQQVGFLIPGIARAVQNPNLEKTQFGWEIDPIGFKNTLREVWDRYKLPIMITENGIGANDILTSDEKIHDDYRIDYYKKHIKAMNEAIDDGVEMIGYMPWSAIDLVSTHEGMKKRYGFVYVNRDEKDLKDMKRIKKDSFFWYQNLIKNNGKITE